MGGKLVIKSVVGKAEIWLDKKLLATKMTPGLEDIIVNFPPSQNEQNLDILIETVNGEKAGLGGIVTIDSNE